MRFWDASALVPLLIDEPSRATVMSLVEQDPDLIVWWGSAVECASAIARRERDGSIEPRDVHQALAGLRTLGNAWHEVLPSARVRSTALRMLRVHPLRSADSLQLAAAVVAAEDQPDGFGFVGLDTRLNEAAAREGFDVLEPGGALRSG